MLPVRNLAASVLFALGSTVLILYLLVAGGIPTSRASLESTEFRQTLMAAAVIALLVGATWAVRPAIPVAAAVLVTLVAGTLVLLAGVWAAQCADCEGIMDDWDRRESFELAWRFSGSVGGGWIATIGLGALLASALKWLYRRRCPRPA
jgi:hypothetical protein